MAREPRPTSINRPPIRFFPAIGISLLAIFGSLAVGTLMVVAIPQDGWAGVIWALPAVYVMVQPINGFVRGKDDRLHIGLGSFSLEGLSKVTVHDRRNLGLKYSIAALEFPDHVREISGLFLTTPAFTKLVQWLGVRTQVLDGEFSQRQYAMGYPQLMPSRPPKKK